MVLGRNSLGRGVRWVGFFGGWGSFFYFGILFWVFLFVGRGLV